MKAYKSGLALFIMGKEWKAFLLSSRQFDKKYGKATIAITLCEDRTIHFRQSPLTLETIVHELFHGYIWESGARSMDLDAEQMEELCAEVFSKHGRTCIATAELLLAMKESASG